MNIEVAVRERISVRAFLDKPVSRETIAQLFETVRWAPSAANLQPWYVAVVSGDRKQRISDQVIQAVESGVGPHPNFPYYPNKWVEPYRSRRFRCGMALYNAIGIKRDDTERRRQIWNENYRFFGAPIGLFFFMGKNTGHGAWIDMGIFLQTVMLAAKELGLGTCPQASLADYPDIVKKELDVPEDWILVCGMSLGYPDDQAPINQYRTERMSVNDFLKWYD
ncbi:MAG: nitroreductase [Gammaproteobacteria bacterium]|nr:nitroreductase [Gammaproteobacteria bacterium]